ncbi:unnamed protein product [Moneuplotes crassus]|uniref:Uncharacterized protein n=1 Tax=Euplotes crassus TaxID=5936 RepID=A0AAD1XVA4_EUPCR|nr:unnamed protein product [Moneuplotes crassus]
MESEENPYELLSKLKEEQQQLLAEINNGTEEKIALCRKNEEYCARIRKLQARIVAAKSKRSFKLVIRSGKTKYTNSNGESLTFFEDPKFEYDEDGPTKGLMNEFNMKSFMSDDFSE